MITVMQRYLLSESIAIDGSGTDDPAEQGNYL